MKKNGFTLIELLVVISLVAAISILVTSKISRNVKEAELMKENNIISSIEEAAYIYAINYSNELEYINTKNVDKVSIDTLVNKGLIKNTTELSSLLDKDVLIVKINDNIKTYYNESWVSSKPVIFLLGLSDVTIKLNSNYVDAGAYVAILNSGVSRLESGNIVSTVDTTTIGNYVVTYSYPNATSVSRNVRVVN